MPELLSKCNLHVNACQPAFWKRWKERDCPSHLLKAFGFSLMSTWLSTITNPIFAFSFWNNRLLGLHKSQLRGAFDLESQSNDHEVTYLISLSFSCNYNVVRTSVMLYLKMKGKTLKKEDWKVCSKKSLGLCAPPFHTWKVFEKFRFHKLTKCFIL